MLVGGFDSLQGTCLQLEANLTKGVCMNTKPKIQDVLRILWKEVDGNDLATEFVAEELAHQLSIVLISILKAQFENNLPYPTLFETEFKLHKSDVLKQKIATDPDSIKDKIYSVVKVKPFSIVKKILNSKVLYSDSRTKVGYVVIRTMLELYKNPDIHLQNTLSFANLGKIVALLKDMNESLSAEDVYALYQRCGEDVRYYTYVSRATLEYIYEHLSEEMKQREFEAASIRSLALCVFGVASCRPYSIELLCKLISHKGWAKLLKDTASSYSSSLDFIGEIMVANICSVNEAINQAVIDAFRNNLHQFRPSFILEAMGSIIRKISRFPKPEYKEVLNSAYDLLMQATVVQFLRN